jgi:hypothetical protein
MQFPYSTITILPTIDIKTVEQKLQENMKRDEYCINYRHRNSGGSGPWVGITPTGYTPYVTNSDKAGSGNER